MKLLFAGKRKKYFQLRICWMCEKQKMVNEQSVCKKCAEGKKKNDE